MRNKLRSAFNTRQYMLSKDFEIYYYSDLHFQNVGLHAHDYYEFYFFVEGKVEMELGNERYALVPGDMVIVPPGLKHRAIVDGGTPYRRFVLWISREYCDGLLQQSPDYMYLLQQAVTTHKYRYRFDVLGFNAIRGKLFSLLDEIHSERFGREAKIGLAVGDLILSLNRMVYETEHPKTDRESRSLYEGVAGFIDTHLEEELSLERLAKEFYVSKYTIAHLFQQNTGLSVHQYLLKKRLQACCDAIRSGTGVTKAYALCGFRDYSSFYRAFRKEYGQSPAEYQAFHKR